jgi:hypothetical protein
MTDRSLLPSGATPSPGQLPVPAIDWRAVAAAGLFAACSTVGAAISLRQNIPGKPLGIRVPGTVATHLAIGWGSALSAPAPMQTGALVAAFCARPGLSWPAKTLRGMGVAAFAGILAEPVVWRPNAHSRAVAAMLPLELASAAALIWAGRTTATQRCVSRGPVRQRRFSACTATSLQP